VAAVGLVMVTVSRWRSSRAERSTASSLLIALPSYVVVGSMTALGTFTQSTCRRLRDSWTCWRATITAPVRLLTTIPPVDGDDSVLVLPHFLGFVLGGAAVWIALRSRRPALPLVRSGGARGVHPAGDEERGDSWCAASRSLSCPWPGWRRGRPTSGRSSTGGGEWRAAS
jgi:hypothetical protein